MKLLFHREKVLALSRALMGRIFGYAFPHVSMDRQDAPTRVLLVANDFVPTLQLSFIKPLEALVESGDMAIDVLSERQISNVFGRKCERSVALQWALNRVRRFKPTVLVFCRYSGPHAKAFRDYASKNGIPVIYHIDDDLLNVPMELGEEKFAYHNQSNRLEAVRYLLAECDLVYFSTEMLRAHMQRYCTNSQPYAGDIYCSGEVRTQAEIREAGKVGYMGFDHAYDFEIALPAIIRMLETYPSIKFELFGSIPLPAALKRFGARVKVIPPVRGYDEFMRRLASLKWDIGICPLEKSEFNSVKANTKWVEYTAAGAAVIASSGTVYDACCADGCGMLAERPDEWFAALSHLIESDQARYEMVRAAQRRLENEYSVSMLRRQVTRVLERSTHSRRLPT
jgi:glycosyltransferase involved in cell wall biosynthesis